jgi:hypothetical protein
VKHPHLDAVYLYDDPDSAGLDVDALAGWLAARLPHAQVAVRTDYLTHQLARFTADQQEALAAELAEQLQRAEVDNLVRPQDRQRLPAVPPAERGLDVVYEATALQAVLALLVAPAEAKLSHLHVMFTANYLGVWRENEAQLRLRAAVLGSLNIISTSGLVEALDLPRQYHFMRQQMALLGVEDDVDKTFADRTLGYGDPRLNEVCKGYLMHAVFYRLSGELDCPDPACRLHLGHSHQAAMRTQVLGRPGLCARHSHEFAQRGGEPE